MLLQRTIDVDVREPRPASRSTILVLSDREAIGHRLGMATGPSVDVRTLPLAAPSDIDTVAPDAIVVDGELDPDAAIAIAQRCDECCPDVSVLLWARIDVNTITRAMQVGVRDCFGPEDDDADLSAVAERALVVSERRRFQVGRVERPAHRLIMVVSPKGGAGKTTMATNLAVGLAQRVPREVALVDADLQFGDVANALRLQPETTARSATGGRLAEAAEVKIHLALHRSGLFVLCAPDSPGVADEITPKAFTRAVQLLADDFRYVVVDSDPGLGERTLSLMETATDLVFVAATDVASVRGLRKTIDALDQIGLSDPTRHFVLNRADAQVGLDVGDIIETIGMTPDVCVPSDRTMPISMNEGVPILEGELESRTADGLCQLVDRFEAAHHESGHRARSGRLRRLFV
ncbi:MAG: P-loop NTPase [Acidimicrobiales bacterium]|nr:P-loop NTPase [Acidimicrobiales bacterium]